jgi:hypothetical protein
MESKAGPSSLRSTTIRRRRTLEVRPRPFPNLRLYWLAPGDAAAAGDAIEPPLMLLSSPLDFFL